MLQNPICQFSGKKAVKFCTYNGCNLPAFICKQCPNNKCQTLHNHQKKIQLKKIVNLQGLIYTIKQKISPQSIIKMMSTEIENMIGQIKQILNNYKQYVKQVYIKLNNAPELDEIIQKLNSKKINQITGNDMLKFYGNLQTKAHYGDKNKEEIQKKLKSNSQNILYMIGNIRQSLKNCFDFIAQNKQYTIKQQNQIQRYSNQIRSNPKNHVAYFNRANAYDNLNQINKAQEDYTTAITLNQNFTQAYINRGNLYRNLNLFQKSLNDYNKALKINQTSAEAFYQRAILYKKINKFTEAEIDLCSAINIDPNYDKAYNQRGLIRKNQNNFKQAQQDFTRALEINPNFCNAYHSRGLLYKNNNMFKEAYADYTKAIEVNAYSSSAYNKRGSLFYGQGKYKQALMDYCKAIELNSAKSEYYQNRSEVYKKMKMYQQSEKDQQKSNNLNYE